MIVLRMQLKEGGGRGKRVIYFFLSHVNRTSPPPHTHRKPFRVLRFVLLNLLYIGAAYFIARGMLNVFGGLGAPGVLFSLALVTSGASQDCYTFEVTPSTFHFSFYHA